MVSEIVTGSFNPASVHIDTLRMRKEFVKEKVTAGAKIAPDLCSAADFLVLVKRSSAMRRATSLYQSVTALTRKNSAEWWRFDSSKSLD